MSLSKSRGSNRSVKDPQNGIFMKMLIDFKVPLEFRYVNRLLTDNLLEYLKKRFEGKCCDQGYIRHDSISIVNYSSGIVKNNLIIFDVVFECQVCYLVEGQEVDCIAKNITKAGIRAEFDMDKTPAVIFVARDHHYVNQSFNDVKEGDKITVKIIGQRFELNDTNISAIAELVKINRVTRRLVIQDEVEDEQVKEEPESEEPREQVEEPVEEEEPEEPEQEPEQEPVKESVKEEPVKEEEPEQEPEQEAKESVEEQPEPEQEPIKEEPDQEPVKEEPVKEEPVKEEPEPDLDDEEAALKALEMLDKEIEKDIHREQVEKPDKNEPDKAITITPDTKTPPTKKPRGRPKKNP